MTTIADEPVVAEQDAAAVQDVPDKEPRKKGGLLGFIGRVVVLVLLLRVLRLPLTMAGAYLLGSVPFSYLVARSRGVDLRKVGSGNIGAANVWRSCGRTAFVQAVSLDLLKGLLPTLFARYTLRMNPVAVVLVGASAMLGHTYSLFMGFRGGKAVATGGGVLLALSPTAMIAGVLAWIGGFLATRISSVGSLAAATVVPLVVAFQMGRGRLHGVYGFFTWAAAAAVVYLHRGNIQRLIEGTENRFEEI